MPWKLILLTGVFCSGLYLAGYRPSDLREAAHDLADANARAVSPGGSDDGGWGSSR